ncbi:MAG: sigma-E factor negative regulatory protein [Gammaproteobacteria bacterium]
MQEGLDLKLSMLLDGELESQDALEILSRMRDEPALRVKWLRYNVVSCACKGNSMLLSDPGFFDRVSKLLDQEAGNVKSIAPAAKKTLRMLSITTALAASVAVVGVIAWSRIPSSLTIPNYGVKQITLATSKPNETLSRPALPVVSQPDENQIRPRRFNDYLITHNESTYTTGTQPVIPYARVISYPYNRYNR